MNSAPMVRLRSAKVSRAGLRGVALYLPIAWIRDTGIIPGLKQPQLDLYRDTKDRLILVPIRKQRHAAQEDA